jgi:hypothetical protein
VNVFSIFVFIKKGGVAGRFGIEVENVMHIKSQAYDGYKKLKNSPLLQIRTIKVFLALLPNILMVFFN